jgi:putative ABC transport system permease protein
LRENTLSLSTIAFASLKRKKLRTVLLIISVLLSVSILTGVNAGIDGLQNTYNDMVTTSLGYTDIIIQSNSTSSTFTINSIAPSLNNQSVSACSPRIQFQTPFTSSTESFSSVNWAFIVGANPLTDEKFGDYVIISSDFSSLSEALSSQPNSCVLSENYANKMNLSLGESLFIGSYNVSQPLPPSPEKIESFRIAGIIRDYGRAYWFNSQNPSEFSPIQGDIFINLDSAQRLFGLTAENVSQVYVHLDDITKSQDVKLQIENSLGPDYSIADLKINMLSSVQQSFASYRSISALIGSMALMIAIMLILNSMFASVSERKFEIGILKAIGSSRGQVLLVFTVEILFIACIGALASIPVSILFARAVTAFMPTPYIQGVGQASSTELVFSFTTVFSSVLIGIIATVIIGLIPCIFASKVNIIQTLRPRTSTYKRNRHKIIFPATGLVLLIGGLFLIKIGFSATNMWIPSTTAVAGYISTIFGIILIASSFLSILSVVFLKIIAPLTKGVDILIHRNILRNFRRSVFTYGILAISLALLISLSSLVSTASSYDLTVAKYMSGSDIQVTVSVPPAFLSNISTLNGVAEIAGVSYLRVTSLSHDNEPVSNSSFQTLRLFLADSPDFFETVYASHLVKTLDNMSPDQVYTTLTSQSGNVILQSELAKNLEVNVGDSVTFLFQGATNETQKSLKVIATTDFLAGSWETIYKSASDMGYFTGIASFKDFSKDRNQAMGGANFDQLYIRTSDDANLTKLVDDLAQKFREFGYGPTITTNAEKIRSLQNSYNQAETLMLSITVFSIVISAFGIMAAMAYTVFERKREIGVLMALGLSLKQNRTIIIGETAVLSLLGAIIGVSSGIGISYFVVNSIPWWTNIPEPNLVLSPYVLLIAIGAIVIAALVSSAYPANKVAKLNVVESLRR